MNRFLYIAIQVVVWAAILAYLIFAARYCRQEQQAQTVGRVNITVTDYDSLRIISAETVRGWLEENGIPLEGAALERVNTEQIIDIVGSHPFIKNITAYVEQSGSLNISVSQRRPIMRVVRAGGDFYISDDGWILPTRVGTAEYVPVVTGDFGLPFEDGWHGELAEPAVEEQKKLHQNYSFLLKLINFVRLVREDPFWNAAFVQIVVHEHLTAPLWKEPEIELIPRAGSHIIVFGQAENVGEKLDKLALFYRNVLDYEGWDKYKRIDLSNRDQVVCRK